MKLVLGLFIAGYPLLVLFGLYEFSSTWFVGILAGLLFLRFLLFGSRDLGSLSLTVMALALCGLSIASDNTDYVLYYPVLMNIGVASVFLLSLRGEQALIEQLAVRFEKDPLPPEARPYLRKLTLIWGIFLLGNAVPAAFTACCTSPDTWAWYNGAVSYALMAGLFGAEWIFRRFYKKRVERRSQKR